MASKFQRRTHPAKTRLDEVSAQARWAYSAIDGWRASTVDIPDGIFCPSLEFGKLFPGALQRENPAALQRLIKQGVLAYSATLETICTMATWRMTQGIYRLDPAVYNAVIDTPLNGDIPSEILMRLPEWCIYIETPGLQTKRKNRNVDVLGAWVRHDVDIQGRRILSYQLNIPGAVTTPHQQMPIGGNIEDGLREVLRSWSDAGGNIDDQIDVVMATTKPIVNLVLYICSTVDFSRRGAPGAPSNPQPKRTRRDGWRVFPAPGPVEWDVGVRMGAALRAAYQLEETSAGGGEHSSPRGHVRRAHWHGYRTGPKKTEDGQDIPTENRRFDLRWMPPIPVNLGDIDAMPATIRRV